ncbi:MAG: VCBS repeat-containing protein [Bacteroidales bacterium]|nr:VCBS repeat-containing protein [Bacteroidales bacterium]
MQKLNFPVNGKIFRFYPVSKDDIWFSISQETYTSLLYHYHDGILENIPSPFTNVISYIHFHDKDFGLFCCTSEVAYYKNGVFGHLAPTPTRNSIEKIYGEDESKCWALSFAGELYLYQKGSYKQYYPGEVVRDFSFRNSDEGCLLLENKIIRLRNTVPEVLVEDKRIKHARKILLTASGDIILAGIDGIILEFKNGQLRQLPSNCNENFESISESENGEIWVTGSNGRILYRGNTNFPAYIHDGKGFSAQKLLVYNVSSDNEYGVAIADFNGDRKKDVYAVCISNVNRLYINHLEGNDNKKTGSRFFEEGEKRRATGSNQPGNEQSLTELKIGVNSADIDNDGDQDIYLNYLNIKNKLLLNEGEGFFRNVSTQKDRACEFYQRSNASAMADVDLDGDLDIFLTSEEGSNHLLLNDGTAHFKDVTREAGLESQGGGMCASFADINNDGYPDLCVSFWYPGNRLYLNETSKGQLKFKDISQSTDISKVVPAKSNAVVFADVNNDAFPDLFIGNRNSPNNLFLNDGKGGFTDRSVDFLPSEVLYTNGAVFADFDLDGFQDLYITNVGDNVLYRNLNGKGFENVTALFGAELSGYGTGCAVGDLDNDGDPDLYAANYVKGNSTLFLNISEQSQSVSFNLSGSRSNRDAVGAKVWLYLKSKLPGIRDSLLGYREVTAGNGYCSASDKTLIFGAIASGQLYAKIKFPCSADTLVIKNLKVGESYKVFEEEGFKALLSDYRKALLRLIIDKERRPEILKFIVVMCLLLAYAIGTRKISDRLNWIKFLSVVAIFMVFILVNSFFLFEAFSYKFFISPIIAMGLLLILHLYFVQFVLKRRSLKEKRELREKLSRDLHDDLASTLGSISIYSSTLEGMLEPSQNDTGRLTKKITSLTGNALQSISDIIWMTSPRNDSLQSLLVKTVNDMMELLNDNGISFHPDVKMPEEAIRLPENIRNDSYLILKEALHNTIKHSGAKNVVLTAGCRDRVCEISLSDDGCGFEIQNMSSSHNRVAHGNGLVNMKKRAEESGIELKIISLQRGIQVSLKFKI